MAIRHLESRLAAIEAALGIAAGNNGDDLDQRFAEAQQKSAAMAKEAYIDKVEKLAQNREADKAGDNQQNESPESTPRDREKFDRFDPSSGSQAQATPAGPPIPAGRPFWSF
jgi:hypothetical protein